MLIRAVAKPVSVIIPDSVQVLKNVRKPEKALITLYPTRALKQGPFDHQFCNHTYHFYTNTTDREQYAMWQKTNLNLYTASISPRFLRKAHGRIPLRIDSGHTAGVVPTVR